MFRQLPRRLCCWEEFQERSTQAVPRQWPGLLLLPPENYDEQGKLFLHHTLIDRQVWFNTHCMLCIFLVLAEIGGYLGLFLGFSIFQGSELFGNCIDTHIESLSEKGKEDSQEIGLKQVGGNNLKKFCMWVVTFFRNLRARCALFLQKSWLIPKTLQEVGYNCKNP